jgi:hypothetical protein
VSGGAGVDEVSVNQQTVMTGVSMSLDNRANDGRRGQRANILFDVENMTGTFDRDRLVGRAGVRNIISGGGGGDLIITASSPADRDRVFCASFSPGYDRVIADALDDVSDDDSSACDSISRR